MKLEKTVRFDGSFLAAVCSGVDTTCFIFEVTRLSISYAHAVFRSEVLRPARNASEKAVFTALSLYFRGTR